MQIHLTAVERTTNPAIRNAAAMTPIFAAFLIHDCPGAASGLTETASGAPSGSGFGTTRVQSVAFDTMTNPTTRNAAEMTPILAIFLMHTPCSFACS